MEKTIKLFKNNDNKDRSDMDWILEFNEFLQGKNPDGIILDDAGALNLNAEQAYSVLWYLREHFPILPDSFTKCDVCNSIFDDGSEGYYTDVENEYGNNFCGACDYLAPYDEEE